MYKVLKDVLQEKGEGTRCMTNVKVGGRVRSAAAKQIVSDKLKKDMEQLEENPLLDLKTGEIKKKKKKQPKEKTPQDLALKEAKSYVKKFHGFSWYDIYLFEPLGVQCVSC